MCRAGGYRSVLGFALVWALVVGGDGHGRFGRIWRNDGFRCGIMLTGKGAEFMLSVGKDHRFAVPSQQCKRRSSLRSVELIGKNKIFPGI